MNNRRNILYLTTYIIMMIVRYIVCFDIQSMNPIYKISSSSKISILSLDEQVILYCSILFAVVMFLSIAKKVFIIESYLLFFVAIKDLIIETVIDYISWNNHIVDALYQTVLITSMVFLLYNVQKAYVHTSLVRILSKHNILGTILILIVIISLNIIYIMFPKKEMYIYKHTSPGNDILMETERDLVSKNLFFECGEHWDSDYSRGWIIQARESGDEIINIYDMSREKIKSVRTVYVHIDENLKMHFDMDLKYIKFFYPLNLCMIVICLFYIIAIPFYKIYDVIKNRKTLLQEVGE
ncbi:MAG: hypothetical protein J6A25_08940 [Lachnospiraceae bacterium]|nr:hypothetical protein [Lachnospiraceae bacterium]